MIGVGVKGQSKQRLTLLTLTLYSDPIALDVFKTGQPDRETGPPQVFYRQPDQQ